MGDRQRKDPVSELYEWAESALFAVVAMLTVFTFLVRPATVDGSSMLPTLHDGERLVLRQAGYHDPRYGDIIVVDRTQSGDPPMVKRVIGVGGDTIDIDPETFEVRRNGELLEEPYINEPTATVYDVEYPVTVPDGTLFVLGDNRNHSGDSRQAGIGMIDLRRVIGKAVFRFYPLQKAGGIDSKRDG